MGHGRKYASLVLFVFTLIIWAYSPMGVIAQPKPFDKVWKVGPVLDQGDEPSCVGYAWRSWMESSPAPTSSTLYPDGSFIYYETQRGGPDLGGWDLVPDDKPYDGTTLQGAGSYLQSIGEVGEGLGWTVDTYRMDEFIREVGPVVVASPWMDEMRHPVDGELVYWPEDEVSGYHAYEIYGIEGGYYLIKNSWGTEWAEGGFARMEQSEFRELINSWIGSIIALPHKPFYRGIMGSPIPLINI
jgi:hypothetical protein